ncbi:apoptosis regulator BAX-like isoform X1 [Ictalurus furcatus]|uniref:apoptosis regulator BAX-like isoform X1 n=1 Tax=Ictalurus furcatus TaxID=66913 RepID=UPI002350E648|nr:apoptosis regulator BAX-like isoform X1 [Ictalurus furcatus]
MAAARSGEDPGTSNDSVLELGAVLLREFIYERLRRVGINVLRSVLGGSEPSDPTVRELAQCFQQIAEQLDGDEDLQRVRWNKEENPTFVPYSLSRSLTLRVLDSSTLQPTRETFVRVANELFRDGTFSWGRVVLLFYLAGQLVIKAIEQKMTDLIKNIIEWTLDYLREHVVDWIREQGGWGVMCSFFGTPTGQTACILLAAVLVMRRL